MMPISALKTRDPGLEDLLVTKTLSLQGSDKESKRSEILDYFHRSFSLYESLFECLKTEDSFKARANPLRHPLIFYYGHTAVFFINKLNVAGFISERIDPQLESMLAIGVDEMSWDDLNEAHYNWPSSADVLAYRNKVRALVDDFIRNCDFSMPIGWDSPMWIIMMGIEHERIHLETSSVLIRELPLHLLKPHPAWGRICRDHGQAPANALLPVAGKRIRLGKDRSDRLYGWDNEYGIFETDVKDFNASKYLVSNQEYLEFIQDGGYQTRDYWDDEGWRWVSFKKPQHPVYWIKSGHDYRYRTMLEEIDMPWNWPVDVNQLEAHAFCAWKARKTGRNVRLPTEAEWYVLRDYEPHDQPDWGRAPGNINLEGDMSACPVDRYEFAGGFFDIIGNVWQWTQTFIDGYEGFEVHPAYDDFSTPTFDGKHYIFKGGSWISTGNYAIKDSRYAFRRHFFQHSGIRYVEGEKPPSQDINIYETDDLVSQYIEFHYGDTYFGVPNFPVACASLCLKLMDGRQTRRALDIGCATGRSAFELAKIFDHVDAIDFSARLIQAPSALQSRGSQRYKIRDEGDIMNFREIKIESFGYQNIKDKINFAQGDACNLLEKYTDYDLVFGGNLIDRLYDPAKFLALIKGRIRPGGFLVLTSPYTWLEEFTERAKWLGGFKASTGENFTTLEGLQDALAPEFELHSDPQDIPFVIRETRRKFQHTIAQITVWRKRS